MKHRGEDGGSYFLNGPAAPINYEVDFRCDENDQIQRLLDDLYSYGTNPITKVLHRNRINLFYLLIKGLIEEQVVQRFDSAIDIGCNAGFYAKLISDLGFKDVLGIDIVDQYISKANSTFSFLSRSKTLTYELLSAEEIPTSRRYDLVLCTEVIEHTHDPQKVADNIASILNVGGIAIVSLPNAWSLPFLASRLKSFLTRKEFDEAIKAHVKYPFWKILRLFGFKHMEVITITGQNLFFVGPEFRFLYGRKGFRFINQLNFYLSQLWPFKFFAQSFWIVLKRTY